jgi:iron complex transport system ATP-binding protein
MIELKELTLGYGQRTLLEMVNARMTSGQLIALLGRNGAGKSTLLRAMMGLEKPQSGEIILQGKKIASLKPEKLARSISFVTTDKVRIANLRCKDVVSMGPLYKLDRTTTTGRRNAGRYCHTAGRHVRLCGKDHG